MRKDIYTLLNQIDHHADSYETAPVSAEELEAWKQAFSERLSRSKCMADAAVSTSDSATGANLTSDKMRGRKQAQKNRRGWKRYAAAAAILLLLFGAACPPVRESVYAKSLDILHSLSILLGIHGDISPYQTIVGKSITKDGVTVTVNDVIWDDDALLVSCIATLGEDADPALNEDNFSISPDLRINGRRMGIGLGGAIHHSGGTKDFICEYNFSVQDAVSLTGEQEMELIFYLDDPDNHFSAPKKRLGSLTFTASADNLRADTERIPLQTSVTLPDGTQFILTEYAGNPVSQKISFLSYGNTDLTNWSLILQGEDNLGHMVEFYTSSTNYDPDTGKGYGEMVNSTLNDTYAIATEAESLTLTPYAYNTVVPDTNGSMIPDHNENGEREYEQIGEPFTITLK